jgi:hypothetical protein
MISGCAVMNSTMRRASSSLVGNATGADLLVRRHPRPREVAVEIDRVVAEEMRRRDVAPVPVLDEAFGIQLVERAGVVDRPLDQEARRAGALGELAGRIFDPEHADPAVAVEVAGDPAWGPARHPLVARHAAHEAAGGEHALGAVGRDARQHVHQRFAHAGGGGR